MSSLEIRHRQLELKVDQLIQTLSSYGIAPGKAKSQTKFELVVELLLKLKLHVLGGISVSQQLNRVVKEEKLEVFFEGLVKSLTEFDQKAVLSNYWGMAFELQQKLDNQSALTPLETAKFEQFLSPKTDLEAEMIKAIKVIGNALSRPARPQSSEEDLFGSSEEDPKSPPRKKAKGDLKGKEKEKTSEKSSEKKSTPKKSQSKKKENPKEKTPTLKTTPKKAKPKIQLDNGKAILDGKEVDLETLLRIHHIPFTPAKIADERREERLSQATVSGDPRLQDEKPVPGITRPVLPGEEFGRPSQPSNNSKMEE